MKIELSPSVLRFIEERKYLKNVTPKTLRWYTSAFTSFNGCTTEEEFKQRIIQLRDRQISPVSINCWLRCINAYLNWNKSPFHLQKLREEKRILPTFSPLQISHLLSPPKTKSLSNLRTQCLIALLLDTGLRITEALSLCREDVDLDNYLITVMGKGRKERRVPISAEMRRRLYTWLSTCGSKTYVFETASLLPVSARDSQTYIKRFCKECHIKGVRCSPHTFRHTFAVSYLRAGGNLEYLRRILGHSSILITQRYLQSLQPDDLREVHENFSPLALSGRGSRRTVPRGGLMADKVGSTRKGGGGL